MSKLIFLISLLFCVPIFAVAQEINVPQAPTALTIKSSTEFPRAGQTVNLELQSYTVDLDRSTIIWYQNGSSSGSGVGQKKLTVVAPANGESLGISARVTSPDGEEFVTSLILRPGAVDLMWEALSYTPPFYKGRGLPSHETIIKVVALPELVGISGRLLEASNLIYTWSRDGKVLGSLSGRGESELIFRMPKLTEVTTVSVEVVSEDSTAQSKGVLTIESRDPEIFMYKKDPLLGVIFSKSLTGNVNLAGSEISLVAYPFYFSVDTPRNDRLKYNWTLNRLGADSTTNEITLRSANGSRGTSLVSFRATNVKEILQSKSLGINLTFGTEESETANPFF